MGCFGGNRGVTGQQTPQIRNPTSLFLAIIVLSSYQNKIPFYYWAEVLIFVCLFLQQVHGGSRDQFLADCKSGVYDGVLAISRTFDSVKVSMNRDTPEHAVGLQLTTTGGH